MRVKSSNFWDGFRSLCSSHHRELNGVFISIGPLFSIELSVTLKHIEHETAEIVGVLVKMMTRIRDSAKLKAGNANEKIADPTKTLKKPPPPSLHSSSLNRDRDIQPNFLDSRHRIANPPLTHNLTFCGSDRDISELSRTRH